MNRIAPGDPTYDHLTRRFIEEGQPAYLVVGTKRYRRIEDNGVFYFLEVDNPNIDTRYGSHMHSP